MNSFRYNRSLLILHIALLYALAAIIIGCSSDNSRSTSPVEHVASSVVFIGDSITALFNQVGFGEEEWSQHPNWINKGIVGQNSNQVLARFQTDVISLKPAIVIILVGTNDVYPGWTLGPSEVPAVFDNYIDSPANVAQMVNMATQAHIKIVIATIPPWNCADQTVCGLATKADPTLTRYLRIDIWNKWLKQFAATNDIAVADYWGSLVASDSERYVTDLSFDGVHPSAAGYTVMTRIAEGAIREEQGQPRP